MKIEVYEQIYVIWQARGEHFYPIDVSVFSDDKVRACVSSMASRPPFKKWDKKQLAGDGYIFLKGFILITYFRFQHTHKNTQIL